MSEKKHFSFLLLYFWLIFQIHAQMSFVLKSYTVSPNYAKSTNSVYSFPFNAYNTVRGAMNLKVRFPIQYVLTTASSCQAKIDGAVVSGTICTFDSPTNQVVINNITIANTFSTFDIQFRTATSRYSAKTIVQFNFFNFTTNNLITNNSEFVQIQNAALSATLTSNSTVVGASSFYTVLFIPGVEIEANSVVRLEFDTWGPFTRSNFLSTNTTAVCAGLCSLTLLTSFQTELLIFSSLFSSATDNSKTITLNSARNPSSFFPLKLLISISASDGSSIYMTGSTTFTPTTTNNFNSVTFDAPIKQISSVNSNINLRIVPRNPINWNTFLRVTFSSDLSGSYIFAFNSLSTTPNQVSGQATRQILLGNLTRSTITSEPTLLSLGNFSLTNPPYSQKPTTVTFRAEQLINSVYYLIDQSVVQIVSSASTILQSRISSSVPNIGSSTTYVVSFVTVNRLVSGSYILVTFPTEIKLNQAESICTLTNSVIVSACSVNSSTSIKVVLGSTVSVGTNLTITVSKITNPLTTVPTNSFTIRTYYTDDQSVVDQLTSGLTFTAASVPLRSVTLTASSLTVFAKATYTFTIQSSFDIPISSIIKITFPAQLSQGGQFLQSFSINGAAVSGCFITTSNSTYVELGNLCIRSTVTNSSTITIALSNVTNPTSTRTTDSFSVDIFNGVYKQEYLSTGIFVTMNQTAALSYFIVTPASPTVNQVSLYTFEINFLLKHYSGDRVIVKFPSEVQLSTVFDCVSLTTNMSLSCTKTNSQTLQFILNYNSTIYSNNAKFTVQNFTNHWFSSTRTFTVQTTTNDSSLYYQQQGASVVNYLPAKMGATINNDNNIILLGQSKLTLTLTSPFRLEKATNISMLYLILQVPTDLVPKTGTCIASFSSSICTQSSTQMYNITNIGDFSSTMTVRFNAQTSQFQSSSTFDIKLYYGPNLVQSNTQVKVQRYCQSPCKQCTTVRTQCISCLPSPNVAQTIYLDLNSTCVNSCPDGYFLITANLSCGRCNTSICKNCQITANTCTSCPTGRFLYNKSCLSVCPNGFYAFNGQCLQCASPCAMCSTSATVCLSCVNNFFLDIGTNNTKCVSACSNTNYLGIDNQCRQCTSNCLSCLGTLSYCTSCDDANFKLYLNTCIRNCPVGLYTNASGSCVNCESPCQTCSSKLACQSCVSTFYLFDGSTCIKQCPNGYIEVVNQCRSCNQKCGTCQVTASNCTSCSSGKFFYQFDCYNQCPPLTYPYNKACTKCITPCVTCLSSPQLCLTCIDGLFLLNSTCVSGCPLSGYIQEENKCSACPSNCLTCSSSINCTLCSNQFNLLQGGCVSSCPVNYPIVQNRQCYQCDNVCLTCQTSKQNCTSCKINLFKYLYTCVDSCPVGYFSNVQNYNCEDGLSSKIVFFPLLILSIIIIFIIFLAKCLAVGTSLPTSLTAILSFAQLAIWVYMIVQLAKPFKQLDVDYVLPVVMVIIALVCLVAQNIAYFFLELKKMEADDYVRGWATNNLNYTVLTINRYIGLIINFKFFRLTYSRFFDMRTLSLPFKKTQNIFPLTTVFSILNFVLCQVPMMICSFSLVYKKRLRDQLFYTSIECLIITVTCSILLLIDIFKSEQYFEESEYVKTRKYLQKIKDSSFNQLQDNFDISKDQGSLEGQRYISKTGGKFVFSKQDPSSLKQLYFQQEMGSTITDGNDTAQLNINSTRKGAKINIFDPIKQEDEQLYQDVKYSDSQVKTLAQMEIDRKKSFNQHKEQDTAFQNSQQKTKRGMQLGINTDDPNWDDNKSMIEQRSLKQKWNNIISHRQKLAKSIFNTFDQFSTKQLQKIIEPMNEDDFEDQQNLRRLQDPFRTTEYGKPKKSKRRKRKLPLQSGNNELQKIYLQRLTEKKQYRDIFASSQSIKYDF